jgi:hypothetical protein
MSCSGAGGIMDVASAATVTRRVLSARLDMTALARGLKRTSLPRARLARWNRVSLLMLPMTSVNSSFSCFSLGATSLLSGLHTPSRYFHTSHLSSSGRPCLAHCRSRGTSTT